MSLIRVQCETCQATLRVRDEGFLGEVHACPRCGSMVLIGQTNAEAHGPASGADAAAPEPPTTFVMSDTLETLSVPPEPARRAEPDEAEASDAEAPAEATPQVVGAEPPASASPPEPATTWAPIATTVVSLVATGAILAVWMVSGSPQQDGPTDPVPPAETVAVDEPVAAEVQPESATTGPTEAPPALEPTQPAAKLAESLPPEPVPDERPPERVALATPPPREANPVSPSPPVEPAGEIDPLAFDPSEAVVILRRGGPERPLDDEPPVDEPPAQTDPVAEAPPTLDERLAAAAKRAGVFVQPGPTDASSVPFAGSADAALTQVVPSIEQREIPLDEAVRLLGRIAGVPITIDPAALRYAGVSATVPIDAVGEGETVASLLANSLKPVRLAYETNGPHITTVRPGIDRDRKVAHRLGDLVEGDPEELVARLRQLLPFTGPTDLSADGSLTLTAPMATQYELRVLCERLRLARGLQPRSKYPRRLLSTDSSLAQLDPILGRRATFSFVEPTPLDAVFDYWRRATGVTILIDWRSLADAGLGPRSTVACSVTNRAWRDGLDGVLSPLGLGWTALDGRTLWVATEAALADLATIEFYAVPREEAEATRADLLKRHPTAAVVYDPPSERLLVRGNTATHRDAAELMPR